MISAYGLWGLLAAVVVTALAVYDYSRLVRAIAADARDRDDG